MLLGLAECVCMCVCVSRRLWQNAQTSFANYSACLRAEKVTEDLRCKEQGNVLRALRKALRSLSLFPNVSYALYWRNTPLPQYSNVKTLLAFYEHL